MAITLDNIDTTSISSSNIDYINDKSTLPNPVSPTITEVGDTTLDNVKKALSDNAVRNNLTKLGISTLVTSATGNNFEIDPETLTAVKNGLINNTISLLKSNTLPLPVKNKLKRAIDRVCNSSSNNSFIDALKNLFEGLSLAEILKIISCLSNPINLAKVIAALAEDDTNSKYVGKALKYVVQTKDLTVETVLSTVKDEARVTVLNSTRDIGKSLINATKPSSIKTLTNEDKVTSVSNMLTLAADTNLSDVDKNKTSYLASIGIKSANKDDPKPTNLLIASGASIDNDFGLPNIKSIITALDKPSIPDNTLINYKF